MLLDSEIASHALTPVLLKSIKSTQTIPLACQEETYVGQLRELFESWKEAEKF